MILALFLQLASAPAAAHANGPVSDSLRLYYLGYPIGKETYRIEESDVAGGVRLIFDYDFRDRGRRTHLAGSLTTGRDYAPINLTVERVTDTSRTLETGIVFNPPVASAGDARAARETRGPGSLASRGNGRTATVTRGGKTSTVSVPALAFGVQGYHPVSANLMLLRFWLHNGTPEKLAVVPGAPNEVHLARQGSDTVMVNGRREILTRYVIGGVVWGKEYAWVDATGRLALFTSGGGGGLSFEAIRYDLDSAYPELMAKASRHAINDLARLSNTVTPIANGRIALVGATLVDGTGAAPVANATVIVENGRIVSAGAGVRIPTGAREIDLSGKTIMPGLWDMHTHINQQEWGPVYLAAGITTVRDMGAELPFVTDMRDAFESGRAIGPHLLLAGIVDGGGPNAFGPMQATTPEEGRDVVRRYKALGFPQVKLYSLLKPDVVGAIAREAHRLGMTVTGHVPNSLTLTAAVDSGMDHIAHLQVRGEPGSDSVARVIAHLATRGTVMDPTVSWGELLQHSTAIPVDSIQPVISFLPPVLAGRISAMGANVDTATANARLTRNLRIIGQLYRAGVPVVAGTDEGIPAFSVYREIELYAMAGMTPIDAIRAASAVSARAMRMDSEVGTIEPGKRADLVVLGANPLENVSNVRQVELVMKSGTLWRSADIWKAIGFNPPD